MAKPMYQIRIIANACITRYNSDEGDIDSIVNSYNLAKADKELVLAEVYTKRPDITPAAEGFA